MDIPIEILSLLIAGIVSAVGGLWIWFKKMLRAIVHKNEALQESNTKLSVENAKLETELKLTRTGKSYRSKAKAEKMARIQREVEEYERKLKDEL